MQNVIAFPQKAVTQPAQVSVGGAKTLFLHIRQTTLIVHLAAQRVSTEATTKVGKQL